MSHEAQIYSKRITDLFPLSPLACSVYLPEQRLIRGLGYYGVTAMHSDVTIADQMEIENPALLESIESRAEHFNDPEFELLYRRGSQIAYRILRAQARLDFGLPAQVTPKNIERYERDTYEDSWFEFIQKLESEDDISGADEVETDRFAARRKNLLNRLQENEPFMISALRRNLRSVPSFAMEFVEDGVLDTYFPFKVRQEVKKTRRIGRL